MIRENAKIEKYSKTKLGLDVAFTNTRVVGTFFDFWRAVESV